MEKNYTIKVKLQSNLCIMTTLGTYLKVTPHPRKKNLTSSIKLQPNSWAYPVKLGNTEIHGTKILFVIISTFTVVTVIWDQKYRNHKRYKRRFVITVIVITEFDFIL